MKIHSYFIRLIRGLAVKLDHRQQMYLLSFITGVTSGLAAVLLKNIVHWTLLFVSNQRNISHINFLYFVFPLLGILLTIIFVRVFIRDEMGHGITKILHSISKKGGFIKPHNSYSSIIASTLTVGFGGSVGLESPIVVTGSSMGSNLGRLFGMNYKSIITLIGCGAAGAIAGIFKAPVAGVVFALEVLMLDISMLSIVPLLISAVTGASISYLLIGNEVTLHYPDPGHILYQEYSLVPGSGCLGGICFTLFYAGYNLYRIPFCRYREGLGTCTDRRRSTGYPGPSFSAFIW